jgi:hypothetical protein
VTTPTRSRIFNKLSRTPVQYGLWQDATICRIVITLHMH